MAPSIFDQCIRLVLSYQQFCNLESFMCRGIKKTSISIDARHPDQLCMIEYL